MAATRFALPVGALHQHPNGCGFFLALDTARAAAGAASADRGSASSSSSGSGRGRGAQHSQPNQRRRRPRPLSPSMAPSLVAAPRAASTSFMSAMNCNCFFANGAFSWLTTVNALNRTAVVGVITSLLLALVVLVVSTSNWLISLLAMSSIFCIMATVFGMMAFAQWKISILESICMIVVVGMSVDYTVHLVSSP